MFCMFVVSSSRVECGSQLADTLSKMDNETLTGVAEEYLTMNCSDDVKCQAKRVAILDGIAGLRTSTSQRLVLKYVLRTSSTDEDIKRMLVHMIAMKTPLPV